MRWTTGLAGLLLVASCTSTSGSTSTAVPTVETPAPATSTPPTAETIHIATNAPTTQPMTTVAEESPFIDDPYLLISPDGAETSTEALPLVILLHGYGANAEIQMAYFGLEPLARERGFLLAVPNGATNGLGRQYWNATDACCSGGDGQGEPDHVNMLRLLVNDVALSWPVDPERVYLIGHSNGGFMSYRAACDLADTFAALVSLAGATWEDEGKCSPASPVSILQIHGDRDETILYDGGDIMGSDYPSAGETVSQWARLNGCAEPSLPIAHDDNTLDLEATIEASETAVMRVSDCPEGVDVQLWTINGGSHIPSFSPTFGPAVIDFLLAHTKIRT